MDALAIGKKLTMLRGERKQKDVAEAILILVPYMVVVAWMSVCII